METNLEIQYQKYLHLKDKQRSKISKVREDIQKCRKVLELRTMLLCEDVNKEQTALEVMSLKKNIWHSLKQKNLSNGINILDKISLEYCKKYIIPYFKEVESQLNEIVITQKDDEIKEYYNILIKESMIDFQEIKLDAYEKRISNEIGKLKLNLIAQSYIVGIGSCVTLIMEDGEACSYTLIEEIKGIKKGTLDNELKYSVEENEISHKTPVGKAILGKRTNEEVYINAPDGQFKVVVHHIICTGNYNVSENFVINE